MGRKKTRSFVVIGLGTFGTTVATELARFGNHVLGIDTVERNVARVAETLSEALIADGRDEQALREAGVGNYDVAVVAIGEELEANILCTMNVKLLGVPTVWVKAMSRTHHRILTKIGADRVIQPEQEIGRHSAQMLHNPQLRDYVSLGNGFHVVDFRVPDALAGKRVDQVGFQDRFDLRPLGLMRGSEFFSCATPAATPEATAGIATAQTGGIELQQDDKLLLLGRRENLRRFADGL